MTRTEAVSRISDVLGFLGAGNAYETKIIERLRDAQRDLEKGKTLPRFLLQEDASLTLLSGTSTITLPAGFLRDDDSLPIHYYASGSDKPIFLGRKPFINEVMVAYLISESVGVVGPKVYTIRKSVVDFVTTSDAEYALFWNYYKAADELSTDIENAWLANGADWLIGEAGLRIAQPLRDKEAMEIFTELRQKGRAAVFGDDLALEYAGGPLQMGANN